MVIFNDGIVTWEPIRLGWRVLIDGQPVDARITKYESVYTLEWGDDGAEYAYARSFTYFSGAISYTTTYWRAIRDGEPAP